MSICIIPARGGSKRIPRKNIREFYGKPIIAWSIEAAKKSKLFNRVVVSTDDLEIAEVAKLYGAEVPFIRSPELADDFTGTIPVVADAIRRLHSLGHNDSEICCLYPTAPFIIISDLRDGYERLKSGNWSFVFSATTYSFPIFRSFQEKEDGSLKMLFPEHFNTRSQDLVESLHDAGQFYWGTAEAWLKETVIFGTKSSIVELPRWRVQDIDCEEDWLFAEQMFIGLVTNKT